MVRATSLRPGTITVTEESVRRRRRRRLRQQPWPAAGSLPPLNMKYANSSASATSDRADDDPTPAVRPIDHDQRIRAFEAGFPVHTYHSFALFASTRLVYGPAVLRE